MCQKQKLIVAGINWEGNRVFTDEYLTDILAIKPGDVYDKKQLESNLSFNLKDRTSAVFIWILDIFISE